MKTELAPFERYLRIRFNQSSTTVHYLSDVRIFLRTEPKRKLHEINAADIDAFVAEQIRSGLSPVTINRRLTSIHCFFDFLSGEELEWTMPNPVIRRRHCLKTIRHLPNDAADEDVAKLFAVINDLQDRALFSLIVGAGLRVSELSSLSLSAPEELLGDSVKVRLRVTEASGKERMALLTSSIASALQDWLRVRPHVGTDRIFLNRFGRPISPAGIRHRMREYNAAAGVSITCRQLRHTFARRLAESGLPMESLARLLGHRHLMSTQRYIEGANPALQADFATTMAKLETSLICETKRSPLPHQLPISQPTSQTASSADLEKLQLLLNRLPPWLSQGLDDYLRWRWPSWRGQTAYKLGRNTITLVLRIGSWLAKHRAVDGWETLQRRDLEAWLMSRHEDHVTKTTIRNDLAQLHSVLRFLELRDYPIDPGLFRVRPPRLPNATLPRYLCEADYGWLEANVLQATRADTYDAYFDRAWFLMLAHTGVRLSELIDLRLGDLNLAKDSTIIRAGKPGRDRVVYLTQSLNNALARYLSKRPDTPEEDHLFILYDRVPTTRTIQRRLARYGGQVGVNVTPHQLRHTFATRLLNQGMQLYALRKLLGHQDLNTTQIYARVHDETLLRQFQEAMARLELFGS